MKKLLVSIAAALALLSGNAQVKDGGYPISPVPFTAVKVTDNFWGQRLKASREVTIPLAFSKCEESGRYENFVKAANPSPDYKVEGFSFDDTDVYKTIEGASYSMQTYPDKKLEKYIDSVLVVVAAAQEPDGYLNTGHTMNPAHPHSWMSTKRWEKVENLSHEFYNLGHMIEGAVAHYQATGKRNFLDIAIKYADCVDREIGNAHGKEIKVPGHQIAEMALAKLYLVTGEKRYLDLAKFFLDKRGYTSRKDAYSQAHKPVVEQDEAVGHAVRAVYMYSGMADIAALTGDKAYIDAIDKIWQNVVEKKLYITGGIGARHHGEAFGDNYELPNLTAYCETCAAIGNVYWNHRLFLLHGEAKYYDVLERTLYNGLISGVSLDGGNFFYPNPLASDGEYKFNQGACHRQPWFGCACCPSNISRFIPSLPGYVYAVKENNVYVNLYMSNTSDIEVGGKKVNMKQTGSYPWSGNTQIEVSPRGKRQFTLRLRIPGWVQGQVLPGDLYYYADNKTLNYTAKVNGIEVEKTLQDGYLCIDRTWKKGDKVELQFDMEPRVVKANSKVEADRGRVAVERGPIVYCAEWADNDFNISSLLLPAQPEFETINRPDMLNGINLLQTKGQSLYYNGAGLLQTKQVNVSLIPYYAWVHREQGEMAVWLAQEVSAVSPVKHPICPSEKDMGAYLFTYFNDPTHSFFMATSRDGYTFTAVNNGQPVMAGDTLATQKGIRDPHIYRGPDGAFYLAMTDLHIYAQQKGYRETEWERPREEYDWGNNRGFVLMKSFDLINWTRSIVHVEDQFPDLNVGCAWAPQTIYDPAQDKMMLYFTMRLGNGKTKLYYAYTDDDFTRLETRPQQLFEYPNPNVQTLDADIIPMLDGRYCMTYVAQERPGGIRVAFSDSINSGYEYTDLWADDEPGSCEAPNMWKRINEDKWVLMYDIFSINPHNFGFCETTDFKTFTPLGHFNKGVMKITNATSPKHGAIIHITTEEAERLEEYWKKNPRKYEF